MSAPEGPRAHSEALVGGSALTWTQSPGPSSGWTQGDKTEEEGQPGGHRLGPPQRSLGCDKVENVITEEGENGHGKAYTVDTEVPT